MSEESSVSCVVCCQQIPNSNKKSIYAIGTCDHSVCYECSTRMRVLCKQYECPICRQQMNNVVFTRSRHRKFETFDLTKCVYHNSYGIYFEDEESLDSYGRLLEHPCRKCKNRLPFKTFHDLSTHMRKEHELFMCDLCVDNLKVFSSERKYYTRKELARHRKSGDPDETSHRGHPNCNFCDVRYVDDDELQVHLRREHFHCHFCDPSGLSHFYGDYNSLRDHFLSDHFLCKECDCQEERFTCAFRSEIDLIAHIAQLHSQNMSKSDLKKAKTLSLDTFIRQRSGHLSAEPQNRKKKENRSRQNNISNDEMDSESFLKDEIIAMNRNAAPTQPPRPEDFPDLCSSNVTNAPNETDAKSPKNSGRKQNTFSVCVTKNPKLNTRNDEEFPALPGSSTSDSKMNASNSTTYNKLAKPKPNNSKIQTVKHLTNQSQTKPNNISTNPMLSIKPVTQTQRPITSKPMIGSKEEFPSLPITKKKSATRFTPQSTSKVSNNQNDSSSSKYNSIKKDNKIEWNNNSHSENKNAKNEINENSFKSKPNRLKSLTNVEEFPVLEVNNKTVNKVVPQKQKPKQLTANPPPGLTPIRKKSANLSLSSVAQEVITNPSVDNMNQSIDFSNFCYLNPIDFNERNQLLVKEVEDALGDHNKFCLFKEASVEFRQSIISGDQYYQKCIELFGKKKFITIFSELLVLLPDIRKQNELLTAQQNELKSSRGAIPKGSKILNDYNSSDFVVCGQCKQVLITKDETQHMSAH